MTEEEHQTLVKFFQTNGLRKRSYGNLSLRFVLILPVLILMVVSLGT